MLFYSPKCCFWDVVFNCLNRSRILHHQGESGTAADSAIIFPVSSSGMKLATMNASVDDLNFVMS